MPAQLTTNSASISPWVVATPVARPFFVVTPVTEIAFDDLDAQQARALGQGHGRVHRVDAPVLRQIETGLDVIHPGQREELLDLVRADLLDIVAEHPVEGRHPAILLDAIRVGGQLDEADGLEAGAELGLLLETRPELARVHAHLDLGLRGRAEGGHQTRRVPGGAAGQLVSLQQNHVLPAQVGQMVGDRRCR